MKGWQRQKSALGQSSGPVKGGLVARQKTIHHLILASPGDLAPEPAKVKERVLGGSLKAIVFRLTLT